MTVPRLSWELTDATGTVFARLELVGPDMFWTVCRFIPTPAFARIAPLFAHERELLEADRMDEWFVAYDAIDALGLVLREAGGDLVTDFVLHLDGDEASFRS